MSDEKYVSFNQLEDFLRQHYGQFKDDKLIHEARRYFKTKRMICGRKPIFPDKSDVLVMDDDVYEHIIDEIQIDIMNINLTDVSELENLFIPDGYRCYLFRHLSYLPEIWHQHEFFELCYVWKGSCTQYCENIRYQMSNGDFLIIPPGVKHKVCDDNDSILLNLVINRTAFRTVMFDVLMLNNVVAAFMRNCMFNERIANGLLIRNPKDNIAKGERRLIKIITFLCYQPHYNHRMMVTASMCELMGIIMRSVDAKSEFDEFGGNNNIWTIIDYMQNNYRTVTLSALSQNIGYNEAYLSRLIKKTFGRNFSQLLRAIRIEYSVLMLKNTEESIRKIGEEIGYNDTSSFIRAFKIEKGMGPVEYRKQRK